MRAHARAHVHTSLQTSLPNFVDLCFTPSSPSPPSLFLQRSRRSFHAVGSCSLTPYAPLSITCFDARLPPLQLLLHRAAGSTQRLTGSSGGQTGQSGRQRRQGGQQRPALPDRLTPDHVRAMLRELRVSARKRGLYKGPVDPDGDYLVVPAGRGRGAAASPEASPGTSPMGARGGERRGRTGRAGGCWSAEEEPGWCWERGDEGAYGGGEGYRGSACGGTGMGEHPSGCQDCSWQLAGVHRGVRAGCSSSMKCEGHDVNGGDSGVDPPATASRRIGTNRARYADAAAANTRPVGGSRQRQLSSNRAGALQAGSPANVARGGGAAVAAVKAPWEVEGAGGGEVGNPHVAPQPAAVA